MEVMYLILGVFIFVVSIMDLIKTTPSSSGGGRITNVVSKGVWKLFLQAQAKKEAANY